MPMTHWEEDCLRWRGEVLKGKYSHWCFEWDDLPIDETCEEWPCDCGIKEEVDKLSAKLYRFAQRHYWASPVIDRIRWFLERRGK